MVHSHHHSHNHAHAAGGLKSLGSIYYVAIALNLAFVAIEASMGFIYDSLGLLSDAGHKLIDVFSLIIALLAFKLSGSRSSRRYTYGLRKTSILISMLNAVILLVAVTVIVVESVEKFSNPTFVNGAAISWTAGIGILVSGASAILLMRHQKNDINTRGAFLHMATDALVSVGVVLSGVIISLTGWSAIDPLISLVVAAVILFNTGKLFLESFRMIIDAVPDGVDYRAVEDAISGHKGVKAVSELHIWSVSVTQRALTAHVELTGEVAQNELVADLHRILADMGMDIVTIECKQ